MPNRGIMRAKQQRAGSLGQGARFYYLAGQSFATIAGSQGFGKTNPSIGSMKSLGVMKQNRNAGGNNICKETMIPKYYYTQKIALSTALTPNPHPVGTLVYIAGTRIPLGKIEHDPTPSTSLELRHASESTLLPVGSAALNVYLVPPGTGRPGTFGTIQFASAPKKQLATLQSSCNCRGPRGYCSNCSGRDNPLGAITGGAGYSSTTGFTLQTH